jgi:hypothetical protein
MYITKCRSGDIKIGKCAPVAPKKITCPVCATSWTHPQRNIFEDVEDVAKSCPNKHHHEEYLVKQAENIRHYTAVT